MPRCSSQALFPAFLKGGRPVSLLRFLVPAMIAGLMACPGPVQAAPAAPPSLEGDWVLHIFIGDRQFDDQIHLKRDGQNKLVGTLTVPGLWSTPIDHAELRGDTVILEIHAPEGKKPFPVRYEGRFFPGTSVFSGFATLPESGELLGGFVAKRPAKAGKSATGANQP
jgi:hypothetical protein